MREITFPIQQPSKIYRLVSYNYYNRNYSNYINCNQKQNIRLLLPRNRI